MDALLDRYRTPIIAALAALTVAALVLAVLERRDDPPALEIDLAATPSGGAIQVYITGAVARPGVYEMQDGDRAIDLLYQAGGPAPEANLEAVNLARRLHDEDQVVVPRLGQTAGESPSISTSEVAGVSTNPVNINTASAAELEALPGIGEVYSQRIVDSRTADGPFASPDDLLTRGLVPSSTYEKIRDLITVGP